MCKYTSTCSANSLYLLCNFYVKILNLFFLLKNDNYIFHEYQYFSTPIIYSVICYWNLNKNCDMCLCIPNVSIQLWRRNMRINSRQAETFAFQARRSIYAGYILTSRDTLIQSENSNERNHSKIEKDECENKLFPLFTKICFRAIVSVIIVTFIYLLCLFCEI